MVRFDGAGAETKRWFWDWPSCGVGVRCGGSIATVVRVHGVDVRVSARMFVEDDEETDLLGLRHCQKRETMASIIENDGGEEAVEYLLRTLTKGSVTIACSTVVLLSSSLSLFHRVSESETPHAPPSTSWRFQYLAVWRYSVKSPLNLSTRPLPTTQISFFRRPTLVRRCARQDHDDGLFTSSACQRRPMDCMSKWLVGSSRSKCAGGETDGGEDEARL